MIGQPNGEAKAAPRQMPQERTWSVVELNPVTGAETTHTITAHVIEVGPALLFDRLIQNSDGEVYRVPGVRAINHWLRFEDVTPQITAPEKSKILVPGGNA